MALTDEMKGNAPEPAVLGVYEGECADSNITNLNGLDITREVWENVFESDEYKKALEHGWYIGYLGHPEDPNCMDFEHACIVMTEGHIEDNGKIYGKFNLIDTPVGRIVKAFQDAGVKFGISVRGAGDIMNNSVDPDTFIFRGFDLVSFPAYPESIPTFTQIAASTDVEAQQKYKAICAAVNANIDAIESAESVEILQSHFAPQSEEYKLLETKKQSLMAADESIDLAQDKIEAMTQLCIDMSQENAKLRDKVKFLESQITAIQANSDRKFKKMTRIMSHQLNDLEDEVVSITADSKLKDKKISDVSTEFSEISKINLKYKQKIDANRQLLSKKESDLANLQSKLDETVVELKNSKARTSNLDATITQLKSDIRACNKIISDYQDAYAGLYANAVGVRLNNISVTASTSVSELKSLIQSPEHMSKSPAEPTPVDIVDIDDSDLVTV